MPRIIFIGQCALDVLFPAAPDRWPLQLSGRPSGRLLNAAAMLGAKGCDVTFVGEAARDFLGDLLVGFLDANGVDTRCIDRYSDGGISPSDFIMPDGKGGRALIACRRFPQGSDFNATWPRIDEGDIVVFGGFFAIDERSRQQLTELLQYAAERKALRIYLPGFPPEMVPRITRVMPAILENLEMADIVMARADELTRIFNAPDGSRCYEQNIRFYCRTMIDLDNAAGKVCLRQPGVADESALEAAAPTLEADSAALAALVRFLAEGHFTPLALDAMTDDARRDMTDAVAAAANTSAL